MTIVTFSDNVIECKGHAETKVECAMLTALTVSSVKFVTEKLNEFPDYVLDDGHFRIDTSTLSEKAAIVMDAYKHALIGLAESYPYSFVVTTA